MFPGGAHDINHHMHIPVPGRVQYYRAEALPFIPNEIKTQLRFPKAYATSEMNMRYHDQVVEQTAAFMKSNIAQNYFNGDSHVSLEASLGEAEVLFAAGDNVKALGSSGELKALHERVARLTEASSSEYLAIRDKLNNIINAAQSKEDQIYNEIGQDFPEIVLSLHDVENQSFSSVFSSKGFTSVWNLEKIDAHLSNMKDKAILENYRNQLHALL
jgi:hypothetical protein